MDLGANDVCREPRTTPNQSAPCRSSARFGHSGSYRLYIGKDYVEFHRAH
jgi:hypothetical protein